MGLASFEQAIIDQATKEYFTPEKVKAIAEKIGPKMEASIMKAISENIADIMEENIREAMYEVDLSQVARKVVEEKFGITSTKRRR